MVGEGHHDSGLGAVVETCVAALASAAALLSAACGGDDDGGAGGIVTGVQGNGTDRAFVAAMVPHHESALETARAAQQRAQSEVVRGPAHDIVLAEMRERLAGGKDAADSAGGGAAGHSG